MINPLVSIIIAVKNGEDTLEECLNSIMSLEYDNYETIVVNDGSTDKTSSILNEYVDKIKVIKNNSSRGPSYSRNKGARVGNGKYIAFTDVDCVVEKDWITQLVICFEKYPDAVSCGGVQGIPKSASHFEKKVFTVFKKAGFITDYMRDKKTNVIEEVDHNASCNVIYKKDVYLKMGGFALDLWPGEDVEFDYRLKRNGYKVYYNSLAKVYHHRPKNYKSFLRMMYRYGSSQAILIKNYKIFRKIHLVPFGILLLVCITVLGIVYNGLFVLSSLLFLSSIFLLMVLSFDFYLFFLSISGVIYWNMGFFLSYLSLKKV